MLEMVGWSATNVGGCGGRTFYKGGDVKRAELNRLSSRGVRGIYGGAGKMQIPRFARDDKSSTKLRSASPCFFLAAPLSLAGLGVIAP
jgi:hypothetical protein